MPCNHENLTASAWDDAERTIPAWYDCDDCPAFVHWSDHPDTPKLSSTPFPGSVRPTSKPGKRWNENGLILYRGPSRLDGAEIVLIVTGLKRKTGNGKTGDLLQTWILRTDQKPGDAQRSGADESICGQCPARPYLKGKGGTGDCYVSMQGPSSVYQSFAKGRYRQATIGDIFDIAKRPLRMGSYGDPAAVPFEVWGRALFSAFHPLGHVQDGEAIKARRAKGLTWTGYTHQWRDCDPRFRLVCMASADSEEDRERAVAEGWRTFRVVRGEEPGKLPGEFRCPSDPSWDRTHVPCETCGLCDGAASGARGRSPYIVTHGFRAKKEQRAVNARLALA